MGRSRGLDLSFLPLSMRVLGRFFALWGGIFSSDRFTNVNYVSSDGATPLGAYVATPPDYDALNNKTYPAAIVFHAWNGMSEEPTYFADRLAEQGFIAIAPDMFRGISSPLTRISWNILTVSNTPQDRVDRDVDDAINYLLSTYPVDTSQIFSGPGFCYGGTQSLELASRRPVTATVSLYGSIISELQDPTDDTAFGLIGAGGSPVLGIYGAEDGNPTAESARGFEQAMTARGIKNTVEIYDNVGHGFVTPEAHREGQQVVLTAWDQVVNFMTEIVASGSGTTRHIMESTPEKSVRKSVVSNSWLFDHTMDYFMGKGHFSDQHKHSLRQP